MARATIEERSGLLAAAIVLLTLADGLIHLSLAFILYHGQLFADAFSTLFVLNFLGALALIAAFLLSPRFAPGDRRAIDLLIMTYAAIAFVVWFTVGRPNPSGLGYLSKTIEVVLVIVLYLHIRTLGDTG
jgi:hypothetical protein